MIQGLSRWLILRAAHVLLWASGCLELVLSLVSRGGNTTAQTGRGSTLSQSPSHTMPQVDVDLAALAESVWRSSPFLRPAAAGHNLVICGGRWALSDGSDHRPISPQEAEEMIAGRMMVALCRMWSEIGCDQHEDGRGVMFVVTCGGHEHSTVGTGRTPAAALLDAWVADGA